MQLWVHLYLNWGFWHPQILADLRICVGIPLKIDANTLAGNSVILLVC